MSKVCITVSLAAILVITTACGADSEAEIVHDVETQQSHPSKGFQLQANNTDLNKQRVLTDSQLSSYADEAGYYISQTITSLEQLAPYFEREKLTSAEIEEALSVLWNIREQSQAFIDLERPEAFDGFHNVHLSTLVEIDALERVFSDMRPPIHPLQLNNARVYYENAVMSHKLMEREYLSLSEEFGFH